MNLIAKIVRHFFHIRFFRFMLIGAINTAFSYLVYVFFLFCGLAYAIANLLALMFGVLFSFYTQGTFVFKNSNARLLGRFILFWILIYGINIFFIQQLMQAGLNAYWSGAAALLPVTLMSYCIQRFFIFRHSAPAT